MKKLSVLFITLLLFSCTKATVDRSEQETCHAEFVLKYPTSLNHVLFTIVHDDPVEYFKKEITANKDSLKMIDPNKKIDGTDILVKHNMIVNYWNHILDTVKGRDILSLDNSSIEHLKTSRHTRITNCFKNAWLFTRMTGDYDKGGLGWSLPLKLDKDKTLEIILREDNTIRFKDLEKIYDSIVK
jgi:hypothetical protein